MAEAAMISIAMTTYNGECFLREQLDSILSQTITDWELVVCDDCSTDGTVGILQEYTEKDARIKIYRNAKNLGFKKNFERAISLCAGDYIALCDQDDVWYANHLEFLLGNMDGVELVGADADIFYDGDEGNSNGDTRMSTLLGLSDVPKEHLFERELIGNMIQGAACMFSRAIAQKCIPFPDAVVFHDHWIAAVASMCGGGRYRAVPVLRYRQHSKNVTKNKRRNFFERAIDSVVLRRKHVEESRKQLLFLDELYARSCTDDQRKQIVARKKKIRLWLAFHSIGV